MAGSKLEKVWQIMRNDSYEIVTEIETDMLCLLCKKLLINARFAPCGCRFCFTCISGLLDNDNQICPGNTEECKLEMLNLNENIFVDYPMNNKLSRLKVKCSKMLCEFVDEISKIEDHSRMCKFRSVACPFLNVGCDTENISQNNVVDHLQSEILTHTKLLMDFIGNFNNEMDIMKATNQLLITKINDLKLNGERKQEEFVELQRESDEKTIKIEQLIAENVDIKQNMNNLITNVQMNRIEIEDLQNKFDNQVREMELLTKEMSAFRNADRHVRDALVGLKSNVEVNQLAIRSCENKFQQQITQCAAKCKQAENKFHNANQLRESVEKELIEKIDQMENKLLEMATNQHKLINTEFVWKLEKFSEKMENAKKEIKTVIYSNSFFTHKIGYKMSLCVYPNGIYDYVGTHLAVGFRLMKGTFDGILEWPFRHSVTLELVNQRTRLPHVGNIIECGNYPNHKSLIQPTDRSEGLVYQSFLSLTELSSNPDLMLNNELFIKCSVDIQL